MNPFRFCLQTFGCKANQYESQAIREQLAAAGYRETVLPEEADFLVLNSCGVTGRAGRSCRNAVRKAVRANPRLRVVLTGCGVDLDEVWPDIPAGPPLAVPNAKKHALDRLLGEWLSAEKTAPAAAVPDDRLALSISRFTGHTRAFLKIQDGCASHCSYCAVPKARGAPQSRPLAEVLEEAKRLAGSGHREIVLTGINIGAYYDGGVRLPELAAAAADTPGLERLRLGSVEPPYVTEALVQAMAADSRICPHVHVPLQSGDDGILSRMGRRYDREQFLGRIQMLREGLRLPAVTTDVIVGFPGEDEAAFLASEELCRRAGFSRLHVFPFSPRPGTPAAAMPRGAPDREIEERKTRLLRTGRELAEAFAQSCTGMPERVIIENAAAADGHSAGLTDRYLRAVLPGRHQPGEVCRVKILSADGAELRAESV